MAQERSLVSRNLLVSIIVRFNYMRSKLVSSGRHSAIKAKK